MRTKKEKGYITNGLYVPIEAHQSQLALYRRVVNILYHSYAVYA